MKQINTQRPRSNSFIELARVLLLIMLLTVHAGAVLEYSGYPVLRGYFLLKDLRVFLNLSEGVVLFFAAITGLFIFKDEGLALRNVSRIIYIIIINFILGIGILSVSNIGINNRTITWLLTGSRDSWYLYAILFVYVLAPFIHKLLKNRELLYLIIGLFILVPSHIPWIPTPIILSVYSGFKLLGVVMLSHYFKNKGNKPIYLILFMSMIGLKIFGALAPSLEDFWQEKDPRSWYAYVDPIIDFILPISFIIFLYKFKWQSKKVNFIVSNMYFIYEFHWIAQLVFAQWIFRGDIHIMFYYQVLFTFSTCTAFSFGATYIYRNYWVKKVQPKIFNGWDIFMKKIYKP